MDKYENKSAVYWFKDENGNVVYVGSTNNLYKRMYNHNQEFRQAKQQIISVPQKQQLYRGLLLYRQLQAQRKRDD